MGRHVRAGDGGCEAIVVNTGFGARPHVGIALTFELAIMVILTAAAHRPAALKRAGLWTGTSGLSAMDDRVKMFEFDARIGDGELPTNGCGAIIAPVGSAVGNSRWDR
jgi:hypothetical protein